MTEHNPNGYPSPQATGETAFPAAPGQIETAPKKKSGAGLKAGIAGLAVLALGAGGLAIADPMNMFGGDDAASSAMIPGDAVGYAEVNFDPDMSQKAEMVRFAMKFPSLKEKVSLTEGGDLKQELWTSMSKDSSCLKDVNYDADIKPWLGDHLAVAVRSGAKNPIMVIEAKDEAKARAGFEKLNKCETDEKNKLSGLAFSDGYLVAAKTQADADKAVADAKSDPLEKKAEFTEDLKQLGDTGMMTMWGNKDGLVQLMESSDVAEQINNSTPGSTGAPDPMKQIQQADFRSGAATLRFTGGNPEFRTVSKASKDLPKSSASTKVGDLPGETTVALGIADGATLVDQNWDMIKKAIEQEGATIADVEQKTQLKLPDDLKTLLGKDLRVSVGKLGDPEKIESPADVPVAVAMDTEKAKVEEILTRTGLGSNGIQVSGSDTAPVLAMSTDWATKVSQPSGKLADDAAYKTAVANADKSQSVIYVNIDAFKDLITKDMNDKDKQNVEPLQAVGISSNNEDNNYSGMSLRVTAK
ncbi:MULTISPECIES: DUF3352 domain-containing protein [unclassified Luteococcus]|uniref:DUF3352 domain-containing protein n=1 Tax=unclassified Luteococcus TaxID=2639923 RepID=UPI00313E02B7